jgi:hypothetical protein
MICVRGVNPLLFSNKCNFLVAVNNVDAFRFAIGNHIVLITGNSLWMIDMGMVPFDRYKFYRLFLLRQILLCNKNVA